MVLALGAALALAAGVPAVAEAVELVDEPAVALVVTEALAAGVLTVALTEAEGADDTDTLAEAALETVGVCGAPGSPPAWAGTAMPSQPAAQTRVQIGRRRRYSRGISLTRFSCCRTRESIP